MIHDDVEIISIPEQLPAEKHRFLPSTWRPVDFAALLTDAQNLIPEDFHDLFHFIAFSYIFLRSFIFLFGNSNRFLLQD